MKKSFRIYWQGKLIADVIDYNQGFIDSVYELNREIKVVESKEISDKLIADLDKIDYLANLQKEE